MTPADDSVAARRWYIAEVDVSFVVQRIFFLTSFLIDSIQSNNCNRGSLRIHEEWKGE